MEKIGPSFYDELVAAGVTDWAFAWNPNDGTITFAPGCTQIDKVNQVLKAHDPTVVMEDPIRPVPLIAPLISILLAKGVIADTDFSPSDAIVVNKIPISVSPSPISRVP